MNDPVISRFAQACGAPGPLDLRVDLADGGVLAEGSVPMPFALIGRDDACDVTLTDAEVNPRHTWLQVVSGRVFAVDLGSRTGMTWPTGATGSGWLDVGAAVRIGPFRLQLRSPVTSKPTQFSASYTPLQSDTASVRARPSVSLEFRNGKRAKDRWSVNRLITLVGRAPECKIHLTADDIAGYHCGLVLTPDGLWVVDLSGRGVVVNGERMRVSPLPHGAELWVGRFLIGVQYPGAGQTPALGRIGVLTPPTPLSGLDIESLDSTATGPALSAVVQGSSGRLPPPPLPEDEVPLGVVPPPEPGAGLPSSHIMADAFRLRGGSHGTSSAMSHPTAMAAALPNPPVVTLPPTPSPPIINPFPTPTQTRATVEAPAEAVGTLLRQLGDIHAQLFNQFQTSLVLMVQLFGCLRREQLPAMQRELARIQELNAELAQLQGEVARRAVESVARPATPKAGRNTPVHQSPRSEPSPTRSTPPDDSTALRDWVMDRINSLQRERQTRWQSLVGMFSGKSA